jgi:cation diffusion facilitator CzcD-associated flavoprotein CzcO
VDSTPFNVGRKREGRRHITIVGAGPAGIATAIKLKAAGFDDFVILEKLAKPGGTWANNRYPGLSCDVPAHLYSFSFEQKPDWSRSFAKQPEILRYMGELVEKYGLDSHIRYETELSEAHWDEEAGTWRLTTTDGWVTSSDVFISALGMFNALRWPDIPGFADFGGLAIHTATWPESGLDLHGKTVAVIGTAASAVQLIPEIVDEVDHLYVHQRTANWVFPKEEEVYSADRLDDMRRDPSIGHGIREELLDYFEELLTWDKPDLNKELADKGIENLQNVEDEEIRKKLYPQLPFGSQRPLFSTDYYLAFNRPNVDLITDGIAEITPAGIRTVDGVERPVDVIVVATGYEASRFLSVIDVSGRNEVSLADAWSDGAEAYLGITVSNFPNLFMLYGPNTNQGSIPNMLELQADYIVGKLDYMRREGIAQLDLKEDVLRSYNEELQRNIAAVEPWRTIGSKYYRAPSGKVVTQWPLTVAAYEARTTAADAEFYVASPDLTVNSVNGTSTLEREKQR